MLHRPSARVSTSAVTVSARGTDVTKVKPQCCNVQVFVFRHCPYSRSRCDQVQVPMLHRPNAAPEPTLSLSVVRGSALPNSSRHWPPLPICRRYRNQRHEAHHASVAGYQCCNVHVAGVAGQVHSVVGPTQLLPAQCHWYCRHTVQVVGVASTHSTKSMSSVRVLTDPIRRCYPTTPLPAAATVVLDQCSCRV